MGGACSVDSSSASGARFLEAGDVRQPEYGDQAAQPVHYRPGFGGLRAGPVV